MVNAELSPTTAARLRVLRLRVTALIALLATVAVTVFAVVVVRIDRQLRDEQAETELLRIVDETARAVGFEDGILQPEEPDLEGAVIAVNPSFDVEMFEARSEALDLPEPTDDEIAELVEEIYGEADRDDQAILIGMFLDENGLGVVADAVDYEELLDEGVTPVGPVEYVDPDGEERRFDDEIVLAELEEQLTLAPPNDLFDEAYRRFVEQAADAAGVELEFETAYLGAAETGVDETALDAATDAVAEAPAVVHTDTVTTDDGRTLDLRATPLRDGPEVRGALIAVLDPASFDDAHRDLRTQVIALAIAIVAGSVVAAWFVAARTITPTAQALAQQERFLADAAHELRTPIAAIRLTAESARDDTAIEQLARVTELAADASTLTDDLLTLARMDADRLTLQLEKVRLDLLVESTVAAIPGATGAVIIDGDTPVVDVDPRLLARAVGNLVRNAIVHGGASPDRPAHITIAVNAASASIRVHDDGPGVDPEIEAELFERFRSRTGSQGHGLGLPLARWIARAHRGDLHLEAVPGAGTTFVLTVPV